MIKYRCVSLVVGLCIISILYQTSVGLLDSLESFLSTIQRDLSAVSGQISTLQHRSKDIDSRLRGRRVCRLPFSVFHCIPYAFPENRASALESHF